MYSLMERAREYVFWTLDTLKGRPIGRYYDEVRDAYKNGVDPKATEQKVQNLLRHAVDSTQFYSHLRGRETLRLQDFPVMNKSAYLEHYDACISETYRHAKDNRIMYTSGSTGTPFSMVQNRDKVRHNTASALFINSLGGYRLGDRQAFLRVWVRKCAKSPLQQKMENLFPVDTTNLDAAHLQQICDFLRENRISSIIGYANSLAELANYIEKTKLDTSGCRVHSIIAMSEHLPPPARQMLEKQFRCPVNSHYSNEENGIMAIQQGGPAYYVESTGWHMEILKLDSDEPARDGELGRIVITDLYNYAFPIIRYDNGDTAIAEHQITADGKYRLYFKELYGRRADVVYTPDGTPVSFHAVSIQMWGLEGVKQWKFVQRDTADYCFYINGDPDFDTDILKDRFASLFGRENITIEFVDEIPVLASGKRKYIECLIKR